MAYSIILLVRILTLILVSSLSAFAQPQIEEKQKQVLPPEDTTNRDHIVTIRDTFRDTILIPSESKIPQPSAIQSEGNSIGYIIGALGLFITVLSILISSWISLYQIRLSQKTALKSIEESQKTAMVQIQKEYEANIQAQKELIKENFKIETYEQFAQKASQFQQNIVEFRKSVKAICGQIELFCDQGKGCPQITMQDFLTQNQDRMTPTELYWFMEKHSIIFADLKSDTDLLRQKCQELYRSFTDLFFELAPYLPTEGDNSPTSHLSTLKNDPGKTKKVIAQIHVKRDEVLSKLDDVYTVIKDLCFHTQVDLFGMLFFGPKSDLSAENLLTQIKCLNLSKKPTEQPDLTALAEDRNR